MDKKYGLKLITLMSLMCIFLTGCTSNKFVSATQTHEKLAKYNKYVNNSSNVEARKNGVIYMGNGYNDRSFGPSDIKFIFD